MKVRPARIITSGLVGWFLVLPSAVAVAQGPIIGLETLTVPDGRLPAGCRLKPLAAPVAPDASQRSPIVVTGSSGPDLPTNPWTGRERQMMATIRRAVDGTPMQPDGPALDRRQAAQYQLRWADGVAEAYRATYVWSDGSEVEVSAVRFEEEKLAAVPPPPGGLTLVERIASRIVIGPSVVLVSARGTNSCFETIRDYIQSLR
jgi:hypothetical protein